MSSSFFATLSFVQLPQTENDSSVSHPQVCIQSIQSKWVWLISMIDWLLQGQNMKAWNFNLF